MAKIIEKRNFRVIVEPKSLGDFGGIRISDSFFYKTQQEKENAYIRRCEEIKEQIKRHVDGVGHVEIDFDAEEKCSHCGYGWEVDESGLPQCCEKAQNEFEKPTTQIL
jgi:hypothetical protein